MSSEDHAKQEYDILTVFGCSETPTLNYAYPITHPCCTITHSTHNVHESDQSKNITQLLFGCSKAPPNTELCPITKHQHFKGFIVVQLCFQSHCSHSLEYFRVLYTWILVIVICIQIKQILKNKETNFGQMYNKCKSLSAQ